MLELEAAERDGEWQEEQYKKKGDQRLRTEGCVMEPPVPRQ